MSSSDSSSSDSSFSSSAGAAPPAAPPEAATAPPAGTEASFSLPAAMTSVMSFPSSSDMSLESWSLSASAPTELRIFSTSPADGVAFPPRTHCKKVEGEKKTRSSVFASVFLSLSLCVCSSLARCQGTRRDATSFDCESAGSLASPVSRRCLTRTRERALALDHNQRRGLREPSLTPLFSSPPLFASAAIAGTGRRVAERSPRGRTAPSLSSCHSPKGRLRFAS